MAENWPHALARVSNILAIRFDFSQHFEAIERDRRIECDRREVEMNSNRVKSQRARADGQGSMPAPRNGGGDFAFHCAWIKQTLARLQEESAASQRSPRSPSARR
jgi:hypothetical protein